MGKEATPKEVRPSTTRAGGNLPSRQNFSPDAVSTVVPKKKGKIAASSPLSKMSTDDENDLTCGSIGHELTPETAETAKTAETAGTTETPENPESSIIKNVESELGDRECYDDMEISSEEEGTIIIKARMSPDIGKLSRYFNLPLEECFSVNDEINAPAIKIKDKDYEFSVDPEMIEKAEESKFYGREDEYPFEHMSDLHELSVLFGKDEISQRYYFLKLFPFTLGGAARTWYNCLEPGCITSKEECLQVFYNKYYPASKIQALKNEISNFSQKETEDLPQAWGRFDRLCRKCPTNGFKENETLDIFYNGLTENTRIYLDSIAGSVFRERTIDEAFELLETISRNYDDWNIEEIFPEKKGGMLELDKETMKEASKDIKEKGIKTSHLKELSEMGIKLPDDQPCFPIQVNVINSTQGNEKVTSPIEVLNMNDFAYRHYPEESNIRMMIMENSHKIKFLREELHANVGEVKRMVKHCEMMNNQVGQMIDLQNQFYESLIMKKQVCGVNTRGGASTQDPDYPEDHPRRKEQEAQKKKLSAGKSPNENQDESEERENDISISDAETEDNNNEEEESSPPEEEVPQENENIEESETTEKEDPQPSTEKNKKKNHPNPQKGKERDPWVQRPIPYPQEVTKTLDDARFEKFYEIIRSLYLQIPLTDAIKMPPYSKYMKDIVTNKRKIPTDAITAMLAEYSFRGKMPEKRGDPGIPTIPCYIKETYVKYALCDLGAGVSVMPFSLYKKLNLNKLVPTEVSLQMADKSTARPIGICEDVPISIANVVIPTDFVVLEMPEDDNLSIILGRPFLNTAGAVIDCTESKVTFNVKGKEHTIYFPKKKVVIMASQMVNCIKRNVLIVGSFEIPLPPPEPKYATIMIGTIPVKYEVT